MKNLLSKLLFLILFISQSSAFSATYTKTIVPETALEYPPINWNASDDASLLVNIGFTFPFGSAGNLTQIYINSNGGLATTYWREYSNRALPRSSPTAIIAPYWDDINRPQGGTIRYGTLGTAPNRRFIAAWTNTPRYYNNGNCTFQVVLYENGNIRFRYSTGNSACNGSSATIGIQETTAIYNQNSYNTSINLAKDILYSIPAATAPILKLQKTALVISDPANGLLNPKSIPGALGEYTLKATNLGTGAADNNSIVLSDAVPSNTALYVNDISGGGSGPVRFVDGSPPSGLSYNFINLASTADNVSFSNNGGATYNYIPSPDGSGVDTSVTNIKMVTTGSFLPTGGGGSPNFTFKFRVKVQ